MDWCSLFLELLGKKLAQKTGATRRKNGWKKELGVRLDGYKFSVAQRK